MYIIFAEPKDVTNLQCVLFKLCFVVLSGLQAPDLQFLDLIKTFNFISVSRRGRKERGPESSSGAKFGQPSPNCESLLQEFLEKRRPLDAQERWMLKPKPKHGEETARTTKVSRPWAIQLEPIALQWILSWKTGNGTMLLWHSLDLRLFTCSCSIRWSLWKVVRWLSAEGSHCRNPLSCLVFDSEQNHKPRDASRKKAHLSSLSSRGPPKWPNRLKLWWVHTVNLVPKSMYYPSLNTVHKKARSLAGIMNNLCNPRQGS